MDLQKNISLGGSKKNEYPTKTEINLIKAEVTRGNNIAATLLFLVFLALLAMFVKFAVVDPLAAGANSSRQVADARAHLAELKAENESYTELAKEYSKYVVTGLTEDEANLADRNELIDLLSDTVMGAAHLSSVKVSGNSVVVTCVGVGLRDISDLVQTLEQDDRVAYVTVSTAQEKEEASSSATVQIELRGSLSDETVDEDRQSRSDGAVESGTPGEDLAGALGVTTAEEQR